MSEKEKRRQGKMTPPQPQTGIFTPGGIAMLFAATALGAAMPESLKHTMFAIPTLITMFFAGDVSGASLDAASLPAQAQLMLPETTVVLPVVQPPNVANATSLFIPPNMTLQGLKDKPFHVHHPDFLSIIGTEPTLTLIAESGTNPMFHEAPVWYPPTDEMFFCQNAGAKPAGTGLNKSAVIQKISLPEAMAVSHLQNAVGQVNVEVVNFEPAVINPNGGTNWKGNMIFAGEGMGANIAPALYLANPVEPYNTTQLVNNYYGRQFNSVNDVAVNPANGHIYFTDVTYGYLQDFRPAPVLKNQVYKLDVVTKALTVVADDQINCNGIGFSPDGRYAYITETGGAQGFYGFDQAAASAIYRYTVASDGTFEDRKMFAHIHVRLADGIHCDTLGNVYAGCGDGVNVWNPSGVLLGKIFTGETAANFQFAGTGRMVILGETHLYYATLAATGAALT